MRWASGSSSLRRQGLPNGPRLLNDLGHDVLAQHYLETALQLNRPTLTDVTMLFLDIDSVGRLTEDESMRPGSVAAKVQLAWWV